VMVKKEEIMEVKNKTNHSTYKTTTGIIMIILGTCMILGASEVYGNSLIILSIPGLFSIIAGVLSLLSKKNNELLLYSGILLFIGAVVNFLGIYDVSIFMIVAIIFGIFNFVYLKDSK